MTLAQMVPIAIKTSLVLTVFVAGLRTKPGAVVHLFRHPALFARSVLSMNIIMPLIALLISVVFSLPASSRCRSSRSRSRLFRPSFRAS